MIDRPASSDAGSWQPGKSPGRGTVAGAHLQAWHRSVSGRAGGIEELLGEQTHYWPQPAGLIVHLACSAACCETQTGACWASPASRENPSLRLYYYRLSKFDSRTRICRAKVIASRACYCCRTRIVFYFCVSATAGAWAQEASHARRRP